MDEVWGNAGNFAGVMAWCPECGKMFQVRKEAFCEIPGGVYFCTVECPCGARFRVVIEEK